MNIYAIYEPTPEAPELSARLRFTAVEWMVLDKLSRSEPVMASRLMEPLCISAEALALVLDKLHGARLIHEPVFSLPEFHTRFKLDSERQRQTPPPQPSLAKLEIEPVVSKTTISRSSAAKLPPKPFGVINGAAPAPASPDSHKVSFSLRRKTDPAPAQNALGSTLNLKPLLDLVRDRSGGASLGQFAIYRMFMKIPQELLENSGFQSLDLNTADAELTDPQLIAAVRAAACEVASIEPSEIDALL